jgi:hypothetical protein
MSYKKTANSNAIRSCGALSQRDSRFSDQQREQFDNRWYQDYAQSQRSHKTQVCIETPKTIISHNQSPDVRFEQSINPYRGLRTWLYLLLR